MEEILLKNKILERRRTLGISQEELAIKINKITNQDIDITQQQISNYERNISIPSITMCKAMAKVLKTNIEDLF